MGSVLSSILLGLVIAVPVYVLLSHFRSGRKSNLFILILSIFSFICIIGALILIIFFSYDQDLSAMIAMLLLIIASISSVIIVIAKLFIYLMQRRKNEL